MSSHLDDLFPESLEPERPTHQAPQLQPVVTGQCAQVLELIRKHQPLLSFVLTADHAIPEAAARVHDLRAKGFNIITQIQQEVVFRGHVRHKAAMYSIGMPEWIAPASSQAGFIDSTLLGMIAFAVACAVLLLGVPA
ncbi:helix-turn-helix domain-containing protein [Propionivibrio sp.]|uniref:helix-turn-helix domain-containing protein n=1 Tax=Propionivibrio sp. TaxID=2212460 RepID=UPI0026114D72|nr:helix-turn-helix domain-containing protein [Propionivibrio sp.]